MKLSDYVCPDMNSARSVRIERDSQRVELIHKYQVSDKTLEIIKRFISALEGEKISAWSLTGPYGIGKSAFINFLLAITGNPSQSATKISWEVLTKADCGIAKRLAKSLALNKGFFQIPVTAAYEPLNLTLARGIQHAISIASFPQKERIEHQLHKIINQKIIDSNQLLSIVNQIKSITDKSLIIVIDEFGKNLDYLSHHHNKGDIFILQQLAEMESVYLWVCLHQAFDEYIVGLSTVQRREWSKIQGRFEDISFIESNTHMINLMSKALKQTSDEDKKKRIQAWATEVHNYIHKTPIGKEQGFSLDKIVSIYPLHPLTAIVLCELCRRFAQNDRTLLAFLCSGDQHALPAYLARERQETSCLPAIGLDYLYDYFFSVSTGIFLHRAESQRLIEIQDIIQSIGSLTDLDRAILKNIGILNLLSGSLDIKATFENIADIIYYSYGEDYSKSEESIRRITERGKLIYREYAGEYRLWEGSDFDINTAIHERKDKLALTSLSKILQTYLPLSPVIASRHAYKTGTIRQFERRWLHVDELSSSLVPQKGFDGLFVYSFGIQDEPPYIPSKCQDNRPLLVAYTSKQSSLYELAAEVVAARSVLEESSELERDGVARKELQFRIKAAEQQFRQYIQQLYSPGLQEVKWFSGGEEVEISSARQLSLELSKLCDRCYHKSPRIGNEMISYDNLSSAAALARRVLIEAMVAHSKKERFGLQGFGPEVAIYRSLLLAEGLHSFKNENNAWVLSLEGKDPNLQQLWKTIEEHINKSGQKGIRVAEIIRILQEPPFGMRQGPIPIYISLFLTVKSDEIAVFQEGSYKPYLNGSDIALMIKRPDLFTLKRFLSNQVEQEVFNVYRKILDEAQLGDKEGLRNISMLGVIGPLLKFINNLPDYSKNTRKVSLAAQETRFVIQNAIEPIELLFEDLPRALGINIKDPANKNIWREELQHRLRSVLHELAEAYSVLNQEVQTATLKVFAYPDLRAMYNDLVSRLRPLLEICDESELKAVLQAMVREYVSLDDWLRGIAGIVVKKPMDSWNDQDFHVYTTKLRDYANRIGQLEILASLNGLRVLKEARLFSLMAPDGTTRREIFHARLDDGIVNKTVKDILAMPRDKARAVFLALAEELIKGETHANEK
ncbi:MAG: hypothetical protein QHH10_00315 [Peptococcaceae bacterium]|jgi:hypothetical protein|nr:hypothetical protein [Peptococcaceae bacterium]MDH7523748.1 hypothetical protein [Peptococcaceae bacterium]